MTTADRDEPLQLLNALQLIGICVDGRVELESRLVAADNWRAELLHIVLAGRKAGIAFSMEHEGVAQDAFSILMTRRFSMAQAQQMLSNISTKNA